MASVSCLSLLRAGQIVMCILALSGILSSFHYCIPMPHVRHVHVFAQVVNVRFTDNDTSTRVTMTPAMGDEEINGTIPESQGNLTMTDQGKEESIDETTEPSTPPPTNLRVKRINRGRALSLPTATNTTTNSTMTLLAMNTTTTDGLPANATLPSAPTDHIVLTVPVHANYDAPASHVQLCIAITWRQRLVDDNKALMDGSVGSMGDINVHSSLWQGNLHVIAIVCLVVVFLFLVGMRAREVYLRFEGRYTVDDALICAGLWLRVIVVLALFVAFTIQCVHALTFSAGHREATADGQNVWLAHNHYPSEWHMALIATCFLAVLVAVDLCLGESLAPRNVYIIAGEAD